MLAATVLVPTHDHGPTLRRSIASALAQTVSELEVLVVGDGAPDVTRELMAELASSDPRVRFFDNPKGRRHGEEHRHAALQEARGEIVCYLSDDDLWLPEHVATLQALLSESDFAHTLPLRIDPDGRIHHWRVDLELPFYRELLLQGENRVPHCCAGHTLELYRRLPAGWRPGPEEMPSDLHMWHQILSVPGCRAVSGTRPTVLHFPSGERKGWSSAERLDELDAWSARIADPAWRDAFAQQVLDAVAVDDVRLDEEVAVREHRLAELHRARPRASGRAGTARPAAPRAGARPGHALVFGHLAAARAPGQPALPERADQMGCRGSSSASSARSDWLLASRSETRGDGSGH